ANLRAGEILFQMKNFGTAQPYLEKALDLNAEHAPTCRYLGEIYLINQDHAKALAMAESCIALGDKAPEVYLTRGKAHLAMGKYQECISDMEEVMSDPVNSPMANIIKAIAATKLGEIERAKDLFSQSLIKFNESYQDLILEARYEYALILANEGAVKDALRQLYIIRNAGVSYKDTTHRIAIFSQVVNSRLISDILEDDAEAMIKNHLSKGLATVSHVITKTVFPDPRSAYILTRKNASGQNIKQALGLDLNMRETPDNFLTNFLDFLDKQELSSGVLFSLFGFSEATVEALDKAKYELTLYNLKDFESLLKGEKPL
ncbi:MAG: tetratricopeptide repeat protein, partial [Spirochaetia bacterium]|nr:tetratricopeptide repeat protein [Spirochaetia bacterium]